MGVAPSEATKSLSVALDVRYTRLTQGCCGHYLHFGTYTEAQRTLDARLFLRWGRWRKGEAYGMCLFFFSELEDLSIKISA